MILFGINFNLYYFMLLGDFKAFWKNEELRVYLGIVATATILITLNTNQMYGSIMKAFRYALFQVSTIITTTGYATTDFNLWPTFSQCIVVLLMIIGACASSTGGGIKVSRLMIVFKGVKREIKQLVHPKSVNLIRINRKKISDETLRGVYVYLMAYALLAIVSVLIISLDNQDFTTTFTSVMATLNNIGPGLSAVGPTGKFCRFFNLVKDCILYRYACRTSGNLPVSYFPYYVCMEEKILKGESYENKDKRFNSLDCGNRCSNLLLCDYTGNQHSLYRYVGSSIISNRNSVNCETLFYGFRNPAKIRISDLKESKILRAGVILLLVLGAVYFIGSILSSPIVNAKKYQKLMKVEQGNFTEDVEELSFDKIPLLDRDTAALLGDRKMGSMVDMVSQFEADDIYSQINYKDNPVRVTPLRYASIIKWFTNRSEGIPAYIRINMANQNTELVKLDKGMKYVNSEYFNRNIYRHLRFAHPTYIYGDLSFEIDDDGVPYWIAPVKKYNIGLFGGETIGKVVICNAITGETTTYKTTDVPEWVDRVYSADLLVNLFDYYGTLKHGFFNSVLSQKDCLKTTDGYNYLALDDDVWMYTGVTSVNGDQSNVGFCIIQSETMETKYYECEGATEASAMSSAEGQVQNLKYTATFPLLLNISGEPTYFIALKDDAGLVKKYAMVNVQKYQIVAIGDSVSQCEEQLSESAIK